MKTLYVIIYGEEGKTVAQFLIDTWRIEDGTLLLYLKDAAGEHRLHTAISGGEWIAASLDRDSLRHHENLNKDLLTCSEDNEAEESYNPGV